jgi:hypothetical protein
VLLGAGLRIDGTGSGLLVSFGGPSTEGFGTDVAVPAGGEVRLTRSELAALAQVMVDATTARLDQLERRQTSSQTEVARALYDALAGQQQQQYNDLRARIDYAAFRGGGLRPSIDDPRFQQPKNGKGYDYD